MKARLLSIDMKALASESIDKTRDDIKEIQQEQLLSGLNAKGEKIGKYRSNKYARVKNQMNPRPGLGTPDLKVTGDFHRGIFVDARTDTYVIESGDDKNADLQDKYGKEILGLNKDSQADYIPKLKPVFVDLVKKELNP